MQKYFVSDEDFLANQITGEDCHHIKNVMRCKPGDEIIVSNETNEVLAKITSIEVNIVRYEVKMAIQNNSELPFFIDLYQGYPKGDKLEDIIKHSTELGASSIYAVIMKRSLFKLDSKKKESKLERFQKIAKEASEQSHRRCLARVKDIIELRKIDFSKYDKLIICYEEDAKVGEASNFKQIIKSLKPNDKVAVLVGPEGGIDDSEIDYLKSLGFVSCGLGPRILRTETASMYVLSSISYEWELK